MRRNGKEPTVDVIFTQRSNPNPSLRILEPNEGVTIADLRTTQPISSGKGEVVHVSDEETEVPQFTNQVAKKLFSEGFLNPPT